MAVGRGLGPGHLGPCCGAGWLVTGPGVPRQGLAVGLPCPALRACAGDHGIMSAINVFTATRQPVQTHVGPAGSQAVRSSSVFRPPCAGRGLSLCVRKTIICAIIRTRDQTSSICGCRTPRGAGGAGRRPDASQLVGRPAVHNATPGDGRASLTPDGKGAIKAPPAVPTRATCAMTAGTRPRLPRPLAAQAEHYFRTDPMLRGATWKA